MKSWSYSSLTKFETCPHKYEQENLLKNFSDVHEANAYGDNVHKAIAKRLHPDPSRRTALPASLANLEPIVGQYATLPGSILVESQIAMRADGAIVNWRDRDAWMRTIVDYAAIDCDPRPSAPITACIIDWKTGKKRDDVTQLYVMALGIKSMFPHTERFIALFHWLNDGNQITKLSFSQDDLKAEIRKLWPRVQAFDAAHTANQFPTKRNGLCRQWCAVKTCEHNGG